MKKRLTHIAALSLCMFALCATHPTQASHPNNMQIPNLLEEGFDIASPHISFKNINDGKKLVCIAAGWCMTQDAILTELTKVGQDNQSIYSLQDIQQIIKSVENYKHQDNTVINIANSKYNGTGNWSPVSLDQKAAYYTKNLFMWALQEAVFTKIIQQLQSEKDFSNEEKKSIKESLETLRKYFTVSSLQRYVFSTIFLSPNITFQNKESLTEFFKVFLNVTLKAIDLQSEKADLSLKNNDDTLIAHICSWDISNLVTIVKTQTTDFITKLIEKINTINLNEKDLIIVTNNKRNTWNTIFIDQSGWDKCKNNFLNSAKNILNGKKTTEENNLEENKTTNVGFGWKKAIGVTATVAMGGYGLYWLFTHRKGAQQGQTLKNKLQQNTTLFALPKSLANPKKTA